MNLDLNLIKALHALLETASVTQMGERLHLSQPAASRIMGKLRDALGDPLLVRTSKGYVLTPLAESLRDTVNDALRAAHGIFAQQSFEPRTSTRQFRVCSTDYGEAIVLQPLFAQMHAMWPHGKMTVCNYWRAVTWIWLCMPMMMYRPIFIAAIYLLINTR